MRQLKYYYLRLKQVVKSLARSRSSSHSIALGAALGFFLGMAPIMGIQMIVAVAIATLINANRISAVLPVWITNPVSFVPVYGFNYWLGHIILGRGLSLDEYLAVLENAKNAGVELAKTQGFFAGLWETVVDGSLALVASGWEAFGVFLFGCTLSGLICAVIAYPLTYYVIERLRKLRELREIKKSLAKNNGEKPANFR